jgi:hypothetical protein
MPIVVDPVDTGGEEIVLDPSEIATGRVELSLHSQNILVRPEGPDWGNAEIVAYTAELARGERPIDFRLPNRKVTIPLLLLTAGGGFTFDAAREELQAKVALIQHEGGWLRRTLRNGAVYYLEIVNAALFFGGGTLQASRDIDAAATLELEAIPDFFGDERELDPISAADPPDLVQVLQDGGSDAVIEGNYPGRVRIEVTEDGGADRLGMIGAVRCRHYSSAASAAVTYAAQDLTPLDAATVVGGEVVHANVGTDWTPVLGMQEGSTFPTHTGSYRLWAIADSDDGAAVRLRAVWNVGDLAFPEENDAWVFPGASSRYIANLGEIRLDRVPIGNHRWDGEVQAKGEAGGEHARIRRVWFQPLDESAWRLQAVVDDAAVFADQVAELRTDGMFRATADGTAYGPTSPPIGDLPRIPVSGLEGRPVELSLLPSSGDLDTIPHDDDGDLSVQVFYRPSWSQVPGA